MLSVPPRHIPSEEALCETQQMKRNKRSTRRHCCIYNLKVCFPPIKSWLSILPREQPHCSPMLLMATQRLCNSNIFLLKGCASWCHCYKGTPIFAAMRSCLLTCTHCRLTRHISRCKRVDLTLCLRSTMRFPRSQSDYAPSAGESFLSQVVATCSTGCQKSDIDPRPKICGCGWK